MIRTIGIGIAIALAALPSGVASQQRVTSMLPAEPKTITEVDMGWGGCEESKYLFVGVLFEDASYSAGMVRLAEQAAANYAKPGGLRTFDNGDRFLRGLEVKDYAGLQRFLKSIDDPFKMDVMIVAIPAEKRFASSAEQIDAWKEIYISDVVELGAKPCSARK
jgi:hypothetical protein